LEGNAALGVYASSYGYTPNPRLCRGKQNRGSFNAIATSIEVLPSENNLNALAPGDGLGILDGSADVQ